MKPFLRTIAHQYASRYADLSQFCFIFPGRRSATFFLNELRRVIGTRTMIAPQTLTISDLFESLSGRTCDNRIDMLLLLYRCYLEIQGYPNTDDVPDNLSFESFRSWGEVILSDFNEIDTHMVNPDELFKNLKDFNEISANYLTDEQREVMEKYFDIKRPEQHAESFWRTFEYSSPRDDADTQTNIKNNFLSYWQLLAPLYELFNQRLADEGLTYPGKAAQLTLQYLRQHGVRNIGPRKIVFVGFNVLTSVEWHTFKELKSHTTIIEGREEPYADFVWDLTGPMMQDENNSASRYVRKGIAQFPKPEWLNLSECDTTDLPEIINVIATPSNSIQAKVVCEEVKKLHASLTQADFDKARVAVVLPDEGLLLPVIHSLPDSMIEEADPDDKTNNRTRRAIGVNLTMGLPLRQTPVVSFISLIRRLQTRLLDETMTGSRDVVYFHEDVSALLAHPYTHIMIGTDVNLKISDDLKTRRLRYIPQSLFDKYDDKVKLLFYNFPRKGSIEQLAKRLDDILECVDREHTLQLNKHAAKTNKDGKSVTFNSLDSLTHVHIDTWRRTLTRLVDACQHRGVKITMSTLFMMADRLISSEKVTFQGEPLRGLQVMGLLETRSLDFDHIIIPSMNERIFPKRMRSRTFIPDSLRTAYGLPTSRLHESVFAYYFYRLISRAKSVTLTYDARTGGMRSGDPSRFILQLEHLYASNNLKVIHSRFPLPSTFQPTITVPKKGIVKDKLEKYLTVPENYDNNLNRISDNKDGEKLHTLSNSSLQKYLLCPLQFYFNYLSGVKIDDEPTEFMAPTDLGNIVHDTMMHLYLDPDKCKHLLPVPQKISVPQKEKIEHYVQWAVNRTYLKRRYDTPLAGEPALQAEIIRNYIRDFANIDGSYDAVYLLGVEVPVNTRYKLKDGRHVNFTMIIDRLDKVIAPNNTESYRIVDYKTSNTLNMTAGKVEDIFSCSDNTKYFFQLMLYSSLLHRSRLISGDPDFNLVIYHMKNSKVVTPSVGASRKTKPVITDRQSYIDDKGVLHKNLLADFEDVLDACLVELFDMDTPFVQTDNLDNCEYCKFRNICKR